MFKRKKKKKKSTNKDFFEVIITSDLEEILAKGDLESVNEIVPLTEQQTQQLITHLEDITVLFDLKTDLLKEIKTYNLRSLQLNETKEVVYSLREADETSEEALEFLKDKITKLNIEREDLILKLLEFRENIVNKSKNELLSLIEKLVLSIDFIDTSSWEKKLDYYRTRFLMKKEQEEDLQLKAKHRPIDDKVSSVYADPLAKPKKEKALKIDKPTIKLKTSKAKKKEFSSLVKQYNHLLNNLPETNSIELLKKDEDTIKQQLANQKSINFTIGKELYGLKKEQGILTMKNYEIVQTLKSRLLNISGSIASRSFLGNGFKDLHKIARDEQLTEGQMKKEINKTITRLLRILGKLKPGEELT